MKLEGENILQTYLLLNFIQKEGFNWDLASLTFEASRTHLESYFFRAIGEPLPAGLPSAR
jgi:hypothetical protein